VEGRGGLHLFSYLSKGVEGKKKKKKGGAQVKVEENFTKKRSNTLYSLGRRVGYKWANGGEKKENASGSLIHDPRSRDFSEVKGGEDYTKKKVRARFFNRERDERAQVGEVGKLDRQ